MYFRLMCDYLSVVQHYQILRCVHTMPRGRMQRTAALPHGKSCLAYAANAIASTFFADLFQVTKTVERDRQTLCDFFFKLADTILKPLIHQLPRGFF